MNMHPHQIVISKQESFPFLTLIHEATLFCLFLSAFVLTISLCQADEPSNRWDEIVGKKVYNRQGDFLGHVGGALVDIENGRYVGMLVSYGGVLSIGQTTKVLPPNALVDDGKPATLYLDMDAKKFRNAPTLDLSKTVSLPDPAKVAEVYRFYGQTPYFAADSKSGEAIGYVAISMNLFRMPVENLQGVPLGYFLGMRNLNRVTGSIQGVLIQPYDKTKPVKIVRPQDLRYTLKRDGFRLNDHEQEFVKSAAFNVLPNGNIRQDSIVRPGTPPKPLVQGPSASDKETTLKIAQKITSDKGLSMYGSNIEVATLDGKTTLRGRAVSQAAKDRLIGYASSIAGVDHVTEHIEVRPMSETEKRIDEREFNSNPARERNFQ